MVSKSPLHEEHLALNATMVGFGGFLMPVQYTSITAEHLAVRKSAGLFDTSHMAEIIVAGKDAPAFLQKVLTNDVTRCTPGTALYTAMCVPEGGTIDDLYIYNLGGSVKQSLTGRPGTRPGGIEWLENHKNYMLVVNASNARKDLAWLMEQPKGNDLTILDISDRMAMLALQGPKAESILQKLTDAKLAKLARFQLIGTEIAGIKGVIVSRTGYTGEDGFELYFNAGDAPALWKALLDAGRPHGLVPAGLGARDTLRLEACYPLYGHELSEKVSPVEAGIGWAVKKTEPKCTGSDVLLRQKEEGAPRELIAFELKERAIARQHYPIFKDSKQIGEVTSGTFSPTFNKSIGLALVKRNSANIGESILIKIRERQVKAEVVKKPFYAFAGRAKG